MIIEVTVRRFFTADEATLTPQAAFVIEHDKLGKTDWAALAASLGETIKDVPLTGVREMTRDEVREYREAE